MPNDSSKHSGSTDQEKLSRTVLDDITRGDFGTSVHRDLQDIYEFYLDDETRDRLAGMDKFSRGVNITLWVLKNSVLTLPPSRRLLLLMGVLSFLYGFLSGPLWMILGFLISLVILLLELKDKVLAQDELETGRAVQFALMPKEDPAVDGWETWLYTHPANEVGGDLVDYLMMKNNRLGIALGDVAGKGLGAALVMAKLQATLRAIAPNFESLAELGAQVNKIFRRDGLPSRFVTLVYLEVEPDDGQIRVLNAGHMPPLAVRKDRIDEMQRGAPAIGLMAKAPFSEQCITLQANDLLIVYSDGLTEARNEYGMFFEEERLKKILSELHGMSAEAVGTRLLAEVKHFVGDARPSDDLSLVVLKRLPSASALLEPPHLIEDIHPTDAG